VPRRLIIEMIGGRIAVRDRARPGAGLVEVRLDDGREVMVAAHLCGWIEGGEGTAMWATPAAAREALGDAGDDWAATLEDAAALGGADAAALLPPVEDARLIALRDAHPGMWIDGPHRDEDGAWYIAVSGSSELGWLLGRGDTPRAAARDVLGQAARGRGGGER
jgi:hypothetical protein